MSNRNAWKITIRKVSTTHFGAIRSFPLVSLLGVIVLLLSCLLFTVAEADLGLPDSDGLEPIPPPSEIVVQWSHDDLLYVEEYPYGLPVKNRREVVRYQDGSTEVLDDTSGVPDVYAVGDWDGDGQMDDKVMSWNVFSLTPPDVHSNVYGPDFELQTPWGHTIKFLVMGDYNGDGRDDLIYVEEYPYGSLLKYRREVVRYQDGSNEVLNDTLGVPDAYAVGVM